MEKYLEYITSGLNIRLKIKQLFFQKFATIILALILGLFPGIILRSYWLVIGISMVAISALSSLLCLALLRKKMILRNYLVFQIILCIDWVLQFVLCQILLFTMRYGFNGYILILILPFIIPVCIGTFNAVRLKNGCYKKIIH